MAADLMPKEDNPLLKLLLRFASLTVWVVLAWVSLTLLVLLPIGYEGRKPIANLIEHWPLGALLTALGLMIAGLLGTDLGLPTLFRDDPDQPRWRFLGRSFAAGFGVALVAVVTWVVIFFCDFINIQERLSIVVPRVEDNPKAVQAAPLLPLPQLSARVLPAGNVLAHLETTLRTLHANLQAPLNVAVAANTDELLIDHLRTLDRDLVVLVNGIVEPEDEASLLERFIHGLPVIGNRLQSIPIKDFADVHRIYAELDHIDFKHGNSVGGMKRQLLEGADMHSSFLFQYLIGGGLTFVILSVMGCIAILSNEASSNRWKSWRDGFLELVGYLSGSLALLVLAAVMLFLLRWVNFTIDGWVIYLGVDQWTSPGFLPEFTRFQSIIDKVNVFVFTAGLFTILFLVLRHFTVSAGLVICMLLSLGALLYLFLVAINPGSQFVAVVAVAMFLLLRNSNPFKYQFPGMGSYYLDPLNLYDDDEAIEKLGARAFPGPTALEGGPLLDDLSVLKQWAQRLGEVNQGRKPKLVLVTATGAAYRASFWTTVVLERLSSEIPGLLNHVRLITGASGGMVGAAYVAHLLQPPSDGTGYSPTVEATKKLKEDSRGDSLSAVVRTLIDGDLPRALQRRPQEKDRGRTLENQWTTLDEVTFATLRKGEEAGWRPSLVLSPMIVETGRRLLFSNLDLYGLTDIQARNRKTISVDAIDLNPLPEQGGHRRLSRSAVEFFRAFPKAYQGFKVRVAVRMSASFPFISPAVSLPVVPSRRVVDAGYYDNYGVNLAASWAFENREWIREHTSGVAMVQIRAYESEEVRKRLWVEPRDPVSGHQPKGRFEDLRARFVGSLMIGIQALTTPLKAVSGARQWSMSYRNDEQVSLLGEAFNDSYEIGQGDGKKLVDRVQQSGKDGWFDTFVFENPLSFGMNWLITNAEIDEMKKCFDPNSGDSSNQRLSVRNLDQLNRLKAWWTDPRD